MMEIMITIAIVGASLAVAFTLQSTILRGLYRASASIRLLFPVKDFWVETTFKQLEKKEGTDQKQVTNPSATITQKLTKVGERSVLKDVKDLKKNEVSGRSRRTRESIIGFVYRPEHGKK